MTFQKPPLRGGLEGPYADQLLHISVYCIICNWNSGGTYPSQCHYHFYVHRAYVECRELIAGSFFKNAQCNNGCRKLNSRNRRSAICIFYNGGSSSRGKCGVGHHCNDVPECTFSGYRIFKQIEALTPLSP